MLSIVGESGWGGSKVTYLKSLYLFAAEKGAGEPGCGGVGVARQAHPVCARCKAGKRFPKSPVLSPGPDMAAGVTPFKKKKKVDASSLFQHECTINSSVKWLLHKRKSCFVVQQNYSIHCIDLCCFEAASWRLPAPLLTASLNMIFMGISFFFFFF